MDLNPFERLVIRGLFRRLTEKYFPTSDGKPTGLAGAFGGQLLALVATVIAAAPFVVTAADGATSVKDGVTPVIVTLIPMWIVLLATVGIVAHRRRESFVRSAGFGVRRLDALWLLVGMALQVVGALIYLPFHVSSDDLEKPARDLIGQAGRLGPSFALLAVALVVGAPVVEEIFYRGLVVRALQRRFSGSATGDEGGDRAESRRRRSTDVLAAVLGAMWFGLIHFEPLQLPALVLIGLVCALLTVRTGRLGPAIFCHAGFNLVTVIALGSTLR